MAGLFFCLASDTVQGFCFARTQYSPIQAFTACFAALMQIIPPTPQNSAQGFTVAFPAIAPAQPPTIPDRYNKPLRRLRHAGGHTSARTHSTDTRYHRRAGTLHRSAQPPIIIRYIRGQTMPAAAGQLLPCADRWQVLTRCQQYRPGAPAEGSASSPEQNQPGGVSMLPTSGVWKSSTGPAVNHGGAFILAPSTRRGSPAAGGHGGRRGTIGGSRRISFRAFAR